MKQLYRILILFFVLLSSCIENVPDRREDSVLPPVVPASSVRKHPAITPQVVVTTLPIAPPESASQAYSPAPFTYQGPPSATAAPRNDSLGQGRFDILRSLRVEPDLNEPLTRRAITDQDHPGQQPMITLSSEKYLVLQADNDLLNNTDRFYTNGLHFEVILPAFSASPLSKLLVPYWRKGINYYGMSLIQNMYTPSTTKKGGILYGDRPYAAYLYLGSFKITNDPERHIRLRSEIQIGVIGSASLGEFVQKSFHNSVPTNNEPLGWEYQVSNDLLLNYAISIEKGILAKEHAEIHVFGSGTLGTVYTGLGGGAYLRTGLFNPYFSNLGVSRRSVNAKNGWRNTQFYGFMRLSGAGIGYDATLQGGLLNNSSPYVISSSRVAHAQFRGSAGFAFSYSGCQVSLEQYLQSPEFRNGWWHKWMSLTLQFAL